MKSDSRIEQMHHLSNGINRAKHTGSLLLALVGVMMVAGQTVGSTTQPSTGARIPGDLNEGRAYHTATLLTTGKVVIVGGDIRVDAVDATVPSDAELFDPETGTWSVTGNLQAPRFGHTATLLTDGKVLVAAGAKFGNVPLNSAWLYDPATDKWSATGNLITTRIAHTATLLPDGKVLVAGGFISINSGIPLTRRSVELYDPTTGTWSETGKLNTHRYGHTSTLLQIGKILVAGGVDNATVSDEYPLIGSAELYDPDTEMWKTTGSLNTRREGDPATLLHSGKVLVAGRYTAELYDPETGTWSLTARLNAPRSSHTATLLPDGRVLAAGGASSTGFTGLLNSSELYDPDTETWTGRVVPAITGTFVTGKKLVLFGENFGPDAVIVRNGFELQTKKSGDPRQLVAKKLDKKIKAGDKLQVLNPTGALSKEFVFTGS